MIHMKKQLGRKPETICRALDVHVETHGAWVASQVDFGF